MTWSGQQYVGSSQSCSPCSLCAAVFNLVSPSTRPYQHASCPYIGLFDAYMFLFYRNQCSIPHSVMNPTGLTRQRAKHHWQDVLDKETLSLPRTMDCFHKIDMDPKLGYNLPKRPGMIAGQILKHCYGVVDSVVEAHAPCIFKIGYTHCAHFRFYNEKFGYSSDPCKWERMIVIHAASETISCSFIEAAIIQRHKGSLNAHQIGRAHV